MERLFANQRSRADMRLWRLSLLALVLACLTVHGSQIYDQGYHHGTTCEETTPVTDNENGSCHVPHTSGIEFVMEITDNDADVLGYFELQRPLMPNVAGDSEYEVLDRREMYDGKLHVRISYPECYDGCLDEAMRVVGENHRVAELICPTSEFSFDKLVFVGSSTWWQNLLNKSYPRSRPVHEHVDGSAQPFMYIFFRKEYWRITDEQGDVPDEGEFLSCVENFEKIRVRFDFVKSVKTVQVDDIRFYRGASPPELYSTTPSFGYAQGGGLVTIVGEYLETSAFEDWYSKDVQTQMHCFFNGIRSPADVVDLQHATCEQPELEVGADMELQLCHILRMYENDDTFRTDICGHPSLLWTVVETPVISSITPASGAVTGGTRVTFNGQEFPDVDLSLIKCYFGVDEEEGTEVSRTDSGHVECTTPEMDTQGLATVWLSFNGQDTVDGGEDAMFYFSDITIDSFTPTDGSLRGGTVVTIAGNGFYDLGSKNVLCKFGDVEVSASNVQHEAMRCHTPVSGVEGAVTLSISLNGGVEWVDLDQPFIYTLPSHTLVPTAGPVEGETLVALKIGDTHDLDEVKIWALFGDMRVDPASIEDREATFQAPLWTTAENVMVKVTTDGGSTFEEVDTFKYYDLGSIFPTYGPSNGGNLVTLVVDNLPTDAETTASCTFGASVVTADSIGDSKVICTAPANNPSLKVDVTVTVDGGGASQGHKYRYYAVDSISPTEFPVGSTVTVTGHNFNVGDVQSKTPYCVFGDNDPVKGTRLSGGEIVCESPHTDSDSTATGAVEIEFNGDSSFRTSDGVEYSSFDITSLGEASVPNEVNLPLKVHGYGFVVSDDQTITCQFAKKSGGAHIGHSVAAVDTSHTIHCPIVSGLEVGLEYYVEVSLDSVHYTNSKNVFSVFGIDSIENPIAPIQGGTTVTVRGEGFEGDQMQCWFEGRERVATVVSSTKITCIAPPAVDGIWSIDFALLGMSGGVKAMWSGQFIYFGLSKVTPLMGPVVGSGTLNMEVYGFQDNSLDVYCKFGDKKETGTIVSQTLVTCPQPAGQTHDVAVEIGVTDVGETNSGDFIFKHYEIFSINPSTVASGNSASVVTVSGRGFLFSSSIYCMIGGAVSEAEYKDDETLHCPLPQDMTPGKTTVEVSLSSPADFFTNNDASLDSYGVTSLTPSTGNMQSGKTITVHGEGFYETEDVICRFGGEGGIEVSGDLHLVTAKNGDLEVTYTCVTPEGMSNNPYIDVNLDGIGFSNSKVFFVTFGVTSVTPTKVHFNGYQLLQIQLNDPLGKDDSEYKCHFILTKSDGSGDTKTYKQNAAKSESVSGAHTCYTVPGVDGYSKAVGLRVKRISDGSMSDEITLEYYASGDTITHFTFDDDAEGWTIRANGANTRPVDSPGRLVGADHDVDDHAVFVSPAFEPADLRVLYGGEIHYHIYVCDECDNEVVSSTDVMLRRDTFGEGASLHFDVKTFESKDISGSDGVTVTVPVSDESSNWGITHVSDGTALSAYGSDFIEVLSDLTALEIKFDLGKTQDLGRTGEIDNVKLVAGSPAITVSSVSPNTCPQSGGTTLTVSGSGFGVNKDAEMFCIFTSLPDSDKSFSATTTATFESATEVTCPSPASVSAMEVSVGVSINGVTSATGALLVFTNHLLLSSISPPRSPQTGGITITVKGYGLVDDHDRRSLCSFGGGETKAATFVEDGVITCESPALIAGTTSEVYVTIDGESWSENHMELEVYEFTAPTVSIEVCVIGIDREACHTPPQDESGNYIVNNNDRIQLKGVIDSFIETWSELFYDWSAKSEAGSFTMTDENLLTDTSSEYLVIPANKIQANEAEDVTVTFTLIGSDEGGSGEGTATLTVNKPPYAVSESAAMMVYAQTDTNLVDDEYSAVDDTTELVELTTAFKVVASGWTDKESSDVSALQYRVGYTRTGVDEDEVFLAELAVASDDGTFTLQDFNLGDGEVNLHLHVYDDAGSEATRTTTFNVKKQSEVLLLSHHKHLHHTSSPIRGTHGHTEQPHQQVELSTSSAEAARLDSVLEYLDTASKKPDLDERARMVILGLETLNELAEEGFATSEGRATAIEALRGMVVAAKLNWELIETIVEAIHLATSQTGDLSEKLVRDSLMALVKVVDTAGDIALSDSMAQNMVDICSNLLYAVQPADDAESTAHQKSLTNPWKNKALDQESFLKQKYFTGNITTVLSKVARDATSYRAPETEEPVVIASDYLVVVSQKRLVSKIGGSVWDFGASFDGEGVWPYVRFPFSLFENYVVGSEDLGEGYSTTTYPVIPKYSTELCEEAVRTQECAVDVVMVVFLVNPYSFETHEYKFGLQKQLINPNILSSNVLKLEMYKSASSDALTSLQYLSGDIVLRMPDTSDELEDPRIFECRVWDSTLGRWSTTGVSSLIADTSSVVSNAQTVSDAEIEAVESQHADISSIDDGNKIACAYDHVGDTALFQVDPDPEYTYNGFTKKELMVYITFLVIAVLAVFGIIGYGIAKFIEDWKRSPGNSKKRARDEVWKRLRKFRTWMARLVHCGPKDREKIQAIKRREASKRIRGGASGIVERPLYSTP